MTFKEYTKCIHPINYVNLGFTAIGIRNIILLALGYIVTAAIFISLAGVGGAYAAIIYGIALVSTAITFLKWWLKERLICLGSDDRNCAIIGWVRGHGPSDPDLFGGKAGDNDYTMNIILAPSPDPNVAPNWNEDKGMYWGPPQGHLIAENDQILDIGRGYVLGGDNIHYVKALHCEFEGNGIKSLLEVMQVVLAMLLAALLLPVLALFAAIIAFLVLLFKLFLSSPGDPGSGTPLDVDSNLGGLAKGNVVVVKGEWIYDSLHAGWNEIHPVRCCQIIGYLEPEKQKWADFEYTDKVTGQKFTLDSVAKVETFRKYWCDELEGSDKAEEGGNRKNPEHQWGIHPVVDGCKPPDIIL